MFKIYTSSLFRAQSIWTYVCQYHIGVDCRLDIITDNWVIQFKPAMRSVAYDSHETLPYYERK